MKKFLPTSTSLSVNKSRGFTLVELLVVITVIAVLSVIGFAVFTGVQKNARDSRRRADIDAISKAIEVHFDQKVGGYPAGLDTWFASGVAPKDPSSGNNYSGWPNAVGLTYKVCADLEEDGRAPTDTAPDDYCKSQQQ